MHFLLANDPQVPLYTLVNMVCELFEIFNCTVPVEGATNLNHTSSSAGTVQGIMELVLCVAFTVVAFTDKLNVPSVFTAITAAFTHSLLIGAGGTLAQMVNVDALAAS